MNKKVLLSAAIAGIFAASAVMTSGPVFADDTQGQQPATGDKASCKGGSCKGEEGKAAAGAPAGDAAAPAAKDEKGKKAGKHKGKAKKKKAADAPAS
jgi:hypothetical protein